MPRPREKHLLGRAFDHVRDHILPHERNNHIPHLLHHRALFGTGTVLVLLKALVLITAVSLPGYSLFSSAITPENIIQLTNETRSSLGLSTLRVDDKLMLAAQAKPEDMISKGYFAHTSPDGVTPWYWFKSFGYTYRSAGENLAAHFTEAEAVTAGWMASPKHRDNIVSERFDEIGVGVVQGVYENYPTTFVVQMFGYEIGDNHDALSTPAEQTVTEVEPSVVTLSPSDTPAEVPKVVTIPTPSPQDETLRVHTASLVLSPLENAYVMEINMDNASEAVAYIGANRATLTPTSNPDVWQGVITYNPHTMNSAGEQLTMVAGGWNGEQEIHNLAWVMPNMNTPNVYAFGSPASPKLLGAIDVAGLNDGVHAFYIAVMAVLSVTLIVAVFAKIEKKRPTMVAGTLSLIGLALALFVL